MQIEAGKFYRTRDGRKIGPMVRWDSGDDCPWEWPDRPQHGVLYHHDGRSEYGEEGDDLIAEWVDEPTGQTLGRSKGNQTGCNIVETSKGWTWEGMLYETYDAAADARGSRANEPTEDKPKTWGPWEVVEDHPHDASNSEWECLPDGNYYIHYRKEPVRGTTVRYGRARDFLGFEPDARDNCKLHFPTLDGELIHGTYTNEAGDVIVMEAIGDE